MLRRLLLASTIAIAVASPAGAVPIRGVEVVQLGPPACYKPNPYPTVSGPIYYPRLPLLNGDQFGSTNPYSQWPFARFRGATYSALGSGGPGFLAFAIYKFQTPQTSIHFVWGTADAKPGANVVTFLLDGKVVGQINGAEIQATFGRVAGVNLRLSLSGGQTFDEVDFTDQDNFWFEIAGLNAQCP